MMPILVGLDGVRRMGKSLGNYIGIGESPYEMMKKFMQLPDAVMRMYFELLTDLPADEVNELLAGHPKEAKMALAATIIGHYHGAADAGEAAERWEREIGHGEMPAEIPVVRLAASVAPDGTLPAANLLKIAGLCASTGDARRAIAQGARISAPTNGASNRTINRSASRMECCCGSAKSASAKSS